MDGPGIESRCRRNFPHLPHRPWSSPSLLYNWYRVFPGAKKRPGRNADPSPLSSAVVKERVELYLYSPYGPYGLYRSSVPVQGWPLPLHFYLVFCEVNIKVWSVLGYTFLSSEKRVFPNCKLFDHEVMYFTYPNKAPHVVVIFIFLIFLFLETHIRHFSSFSVLGYKIKWYGRVKQ